MPTPLARRRVLAHATTLSPALGAPALWAQAGQLFPEAVAEIARFLG